MERIKEYKWYIIIFLIAIFLSIVLFNYLNDKSTPTVYHNYINIDNETFIENNSGTFSFVNSTMVRNKNVRIIKDDEFLGEYTFNNYDKDQLISVYKKNGKYYNFYAPFIGIDDSTNVIRFNKEKLNNRDINYINKIFRKNITSLSELHNSYKISIDFDNDKIEETLYIVTYVKYLEEDSLETNLESNTLIEEPEEKSPETDTLTDGFSLVFFVDNENITKIIESNLMTYSDDYTELPYYSVANVLDFNLDNEYEILLNVAINDKPAYKMLAFKNGVLEIVLDKINEK